MIWIPRRRTPIHLLPLHQRNQIPWGERIEMWLERFKLIQMMKADAWAYNDLREPFISANVPAVTLATTNKALYRVQDFPALGAGYFNQRLGKKIAIRLFGQITTALTPGNGQFSVLYGTGADANGVALASSAADTLIASQTNLSWSLEVFVSTRSLGTTGTLMCTGEGLYNSAVVAAHHSRVPASAPAASAAVDLTANLIPSVQYNRSGSTVETMQVVDMEVVALN
jgi:hypothetical protein